MDLSVCTIVRDEEANIPALARCLPLGRVEWVVVDTGSRDATPRLLREAGAEPHAFAWVDDFSAARNASLERATRSWILWLDADDPPEEILRRAHDEPRLSPATGPRASAAQ